MANNKIKQFRTQLKLSQRELAELAGTSQQQIQRIESGKIATSMETARAICATLKKPFEVVFPEAARAMAKLHEEVSRTRYLDDEALERASSVGVEADGRDWYLKVRLRGRDEAAIYRIAPATYRRLYSEVQRESEAGMTFVVFDSHTHVIALNQAEVVSCQFLFEPFGTPEDSEQEGSTVRIYPTGGGTLVEFEVDADYPEDDDGIGQLGHVFFMLDMGADAGDRFRIVDEDGEHAFIRAGGIAAFEVPRHLVAVDEDERKDEDEDSES